MKLFSFLKSKTFLFQIVLAVIGLLLFVFLLKWWLGFTTNHSQKILVPNLEKKTLAEVSRTLEDLSLQFVVLDSSSYNPDFPKKSVIEQNPFAGDFVKENRKIYLTLNPSKYRDLPFPDVFGKTKRQATTQLLSAGFKVGKKFFWVSDIGKNVVRGVKFNNTKLKIGDKIPKNATLQLILGDGKGR